MPPERFSEENGANLLGSALKRRLDSMRHIGAVLGLIVVACVARLYRLDGPVLRWDEGWSLAHASLPWPQLWSVAVQEWHPPLYNALLKLWLVTGKTAWGLRYLSVLFGTLAVPLSYVVARAWCGKERVAILAGGFGALWPLLVYYGQVNRMYAFAALPTLAAAWFALRTQRNPRAFVGLVFASLIGLYTLYYTVWTLAGIWLYIAFRQPRRLALLALAGLATFIGYLPWLWTARETIAMRVGTGAAAGGNPLSGTWQMLGPTLQGLAFTYGRGWPAAALLVALLLLGFVAGPKNRSEWKGLALPLFVVAINVLGIAYGAQASRWFAVRHLVPASAFLGLLVAWTLDRLGRLWQPLLPLALLALAVTYWPVSTRFVYEKNLEVVDPFDPSADYRYLSGRTAPNDLVYFNVLAKAGWYESLRRAGDPAWSYAMRWDPIIEPMERIAARIEANAREHQRLWFVLYKGTFGPNAELKTWLDGRFYPAGGEWLGDTLYLAYAAPSGHWITEQLEAAFVNGIRLVTAQWSTESEPGGACTLALTWTADSHIVGYYKVFVHALDDTGRIVTQHDAVPGKEDYPTPLWQPNELIVDRHGLLLPVECPERLHIRIGLYDAGTGERLRLADGSDALELGTLLVR